MLDDDDDGLDLVSHVSEVAVDVERRIAYRNPQIIVQQEEDILELRLIATPRGRCLEGGNVHAQRARADK